MKTKIHVYLKDHNFGVLWIMKASKDKHDNSYSIEGFVDPDDTRLRKGKNNKKLKNSNYNQIRRYVYNFGML